MKASNTFIIICAVAGFGLGCYDLIHSDKPILSLFKDNEALPSTPDKFDVASTPCGFDITGSEPFCLNLTEDDYLVWHRESKFPSKRGAGTGFHQVLEFTTANGTYCVEGSQGITCDFGGRHAR